MTKNTLLKIGIIICKFIRLFYIIAFIVFTVVFVHFQLSPSSYDNIDFDIKMNSAGISITKSTSTKTDVEGKVTDNSEVFNLKHLKAGSLYFNFIKYSLVMLLSFLCVSEFQRVIESVKEIKTFQKRNVSSFRRMGKYLLMICALVSYNIYTCQQGEQSGFNISFGLLILALISYIMAEIFKEGNKLSEENQLTV